MPGNKFFVKKMAASLANKQFFGSVLSMSLLVMFLDEENTLIC